MARKALRIPQWRNGGEREAIADWGDNSDGCSEHTSSKSSSDPSTSSLSTYTSALGSGKSRKMNGKVSGGVSSLWSSLCMTAGKSNTPGS